MSNPLNLDANSPASRENLPTILSGITAHRTLKPGSASCKNIPAEQAIIQAYLVAKANDNDRLKAQRRIASEYLEPQCNRMSTAWSVVRRFAYQEFSNSTSFFREGAFEEYENENHTIDRKSHNRYLESARNGLAHVIECFEAFKRNIPHSISVNMRVHELKRPRGCKPDKRKYVVKNLEAAFDKEDLGDFKRYQREAWQILEKQWLKIWETRKALFEADYIGDPQCYIGPGEDRRD